MYKINHAGNLLRWLSGEIDVDVWYIFFFKQKTAYEIVSRDWSSDVCSSDLIARFLPIYLEFVEI